MTMIERVARAIAAAEGFNLPHDMTLPYADGSRVGKAIYKARAAIEAMREPDDAMLPKDGVFIGFGHDADGIEDNMYVDRDEALDVWQAMIDAALKEKV